MIFSSCFLKWLTFICNLSQYFQIQIRILKLDNNQFINQQEQNYLMSQPLQSSGRYASAIEIIPKKSQWALINDYKVLQIEKQKQLQNSIKRQKQRSFREHLDQQLISKDQLKVKQKERQQNYYESVLKKDQELQEKQIMKRNYQINKYKNFSQNNKELQMLGKNSRAKSNENPTDSFEIGAISLQQQKLRKDKARKQIVDSLDKQLRIKAQQKAKQRERSLQLDKETVKYQTDHNKSEREKYPRNFDNQNKNIYHHFDRLNKQKSLRERQRDEMLINRARQQKLREEEQKFLQKKFEKEEKNIQVKEYLDNQVQIHQRRLSQQKRVNPQEHSYSVLGNLFRDKPSPYDKKQYYQYLQSQAQEKKSRQNKYGYMNEEEYKINLNQLNRAVSGQYVHNSYIDRSLASLGDDQRFRKGEISIHNDDTKAVKINIDHIKQTTKSQDRY